MVETAPIKASNGCSLQQKTITTSFNQVHFYLILRFNKLSAMRWAIACNIRFFNEFILSVIPEG